MSHNIKVNVKSAVEDFYPGLTSEQVNYIADLIHARWDYSSIYDEIHQEIESIAYRKGIELEGKDGTTLVDNVPQLNVIKGGQS